MTPLKLFAAAGMAALFVAVQGCGYYSSKPADGPGVTEAELKKMMEPGPDGPPPPVVLESTAEELMENLAFSMSAGPTKSALAKSKRRLLGKVLEVSPAESESPFLILDGGTQQGKAQKVKCILMADEREALKQVKAGDEVRIEGRSDGTVTEGTLEFKDCVLVTGSETKPAPEEPEAGKEKSPSPKP